MNVIAELTIIPIGTGLSFSTYIAECENVLKNKGLTIQLHAEGTNIEGDLDVVVDAIKHCIEAVHKLGAPRIITDIKISSRTDKVENMVNSVKSKIQDRNYLEPQYKYLYNCVFLKVSSATII